MKLQRRTVPNSVPLGNVIQATFCQPLTAQGVRRGPAVSFDHLIARPTRGTGRSASVGPMSEAICRSVENPDIANAHPGYGIGRYLAARMSASDMRERKTSPTFRISWRYHITWNGLTTMFRYRRNFVPGGTYFFTITLADRRSNALVDWIGALRSAFRVVRRTKPFAIDAIVILPDHLHAVLTLPPNDADFPSRWRRIKGHFSSTLISANADLKRRPNGDLALWQRRFWEHTIRDDRDLARHIDYVHFNPVKHGLVQRVRDWPYSSFHRLCARACCQRIGRVISVKANLVLASQLFGRSPHQRQRHAGEGPPDIASLIRATVLAP